MQHRTSQAHRAWWFPAVGLAIVVALTWAPVYAAGVSAASAESGSSQAPFTPNVGAAAPAAKFAESETPAAGSATLVSALPKRSAPVPKAVPKVAASRSTRSTARVSTVRRTTTVRATSTSTRSSSGGSELSRARAILRSLIAAHPILAGSTVSIGRTPGGYQAVCYYKSGRILVSPTHTAPLRTIMNHEVWHIIDWRDNGRIDWGEAVPR